MLPIAGKTANAATRCLSLWPWLHTGSLPGHVFEL